MATPVMATPVARRFNYVATANKPTAVTHSTVGNFTSAEDRNLIISKETCFEIHLITANGLQHVLDVPMYGCIATFELYRPHGEARDLLFVVTRRDEYFILEWDAVSSGVTTRAKGDGKFSGSADHILACNQVVIIEPNRRLFGLYVFRCSLKVTQFDKIGQLTEADTIRLLPVKSIWDIKFLYGCTKPTIAVLRQEANSSARHIVTYEVVFQKSFVGGYWTVDRVDLFSCDDLDISASLLIPIPSPLCGVVAVGASSITYISASTLTTIPIKSSTTAYGRLDDFRYLLGDSNGALYLLEVTHEDEKVTGLKHMLLGRTSIASTISYLHNSHVYIGSASEDSQLIKLNLEPNAKGSHVEFIERYDNLGPIIDLFAAGKVVTFSGCYDTSLRIFCSKIIINVQESVDFPFINGMWSLKSATDDVYDTFLALSLISGSRLIIILEMNSEGIIAETEIAGFSSEVETLFCQGVVHKQLMQVTKNSVKLVSSTSRVMLDEWFAPTENSINVATANATQVLLATRDKDLFYLQICDGVLNNLKKAKLECEIACLDITPIGGNPNYSHLAAVGTWTSRMRIYSLPCLDLLTEERLVTEDEERKERHMMPRSVLICSFDGVSYLLCGFGDGCLLSFVLNMDTGKLTDRMEVRVGTQEISLRTFSIRNAAFSFAVSDQPAVICIRNKKLSCMDVNLNEVRHMCPFNTAACPDGLAIAKGSELAFATTDGTRNLISRGTQTQNLISRTLPLGQLRYTCHQEQTGTFALSRSQLKERHSICLLNDESFDFTASYPLNQEELVSRIISCSFSGDANVYYCVGTAFRIPGESKMGKGRIIVLGVKDGNLELVSEIETEGRVYTLNGFNGKLLASINQHILVYNWVLRDEGLRELQSECSQRILNGDIAVIDVKTRGDFIFLLHQSGNDREIHLLMYKHESRTFERLVDRHAGMSFYGIVAIEILDDEVLLVSDKECNLYTLMKTPELSVSGQYHLGRCVRRFRHGSLASHPPDSEYGGIPTVIFGTDDGVVGVIASLPEDRYLLLEKLQVYMRRHKKGIGGLSHEDWRGLCRPRLYLSEGWERSRTDGCEMQQEEDFLDGDFISSFLELTDSDKEEISQALSLPVGELIKTVKNLNIALFGMP